MTNIELWLKLYLNPPKKQRQYLNSGTSEQVLLSETYLQTWLSRYSEPISKRDTDKLLSWASTENQGLICLPDMPEQIQKIPDPPALLFYQGDIGLIHKTIIGIVGARKPSHAGKENAMLFGHHLAEAGLVIISGMAEGIDATAHKAALNNKKPTIAVLGCGLNHCYPVKHRQLKERISAHGLLLSEFPPGKGVERWQFPHRNRLISGFSAGVLIIEAAVKSGSLITANVGAEQGRQVFAVPGDIQNPMVTGCHQLIREGAELVTHPGEILSAIYWTQPELTFPERKDDEQQLSKNEKRLITILDRTPRQVDIIQARSGFELTLVLDVLFSLELKGMIIRSSDGYYKPNQGDTC